MSSYFLGLFHKKNSRLKTHSDELHLMHAVPGEGFGAINKNFLIFCSATVCHSHLHQTHLFWMSLEVKLDTATFRGNLWQRMDYFLFHHPVTLRIIPSSGHTAYYSIIWSHYALFHHLVTLRIIPSFGHTVYYSIIWSHWMTVTTKKVAMFSVADHWWMMYWSSLDSSFSAVRSFASAATRYQTSFTCFTTSTMSSQSRGTFQRLPSLQPRPPWPSWPRPTRQLRSQRLRRLLTSQTRPRTW